MLNGIIQYQIGFRLLVTELIDNDLSLSRKQLKNLKTSYSSYNIRKTFHYVLINFPFLLDPVF